MRRMSTLTLALITLLGGIAAGAEGAGVSYDIDLHVDLASGQYDGEATILWTNETGHPLEEVFFRLYANDDAIYGPARVDIPLIMVDGVEADPLWFLDDTVVLVPLADPLGAGQTASLHLWFNGRTVDIRGREADPGLGYGLLTQAADTLVLSAFYPMIAPWTDEGWVLDPVEPIGDALFSDAADYRVYLTYDGDATPYATGITVSHEASDAGGEAVFSVENARDFTLVFADGHEVVEAETSGVRLRAAFAQVLTAQETLDVARATLDFLTERIGPLPYHEIELVEVPLHRVAGVEMTGVILVSSQYSQRPDDAFFPVIISHEMVHQWFYAAVGNDVFEDPWLDEGLVTYLSYVALGDLYGDSVRSMHTGNAQRAYGRIAEQYPALSIDDPLHRFPNSGVYSSFVYSGGATLFDAIHQYVGGEAFYDGLTRYYDTAIYTIAEPHVLIDALEAACGCDLTPLLDAFGVSR